ncbi:MAG: hypothetical protein KI786_04520 [Mameliella sp.]|nr:hypothetical protein [Phaeodactylibacter sp.]NRA48863.1 hypothetical protein [Phaeodactylibacter sp.]
MNTHTLTIDAQPETTTRINIKKVAIGAACISFFPMVYILGKMIMALG